MNPTLTGGEPLPVRLVVSEVRAADGTVLARWLLLTNVPVAVDAATVALWYYWRWQVETGHPHCTSRHRWVAAEPVAYHCCQGVA